MRILIISYFFAPVGGVATERIRKFTKYLPEFGLKPIVLTQTLNTYQLLKPQEIDESVLDEMPEETVIHRVASPILRRDLPGKMRSFTNRVISLFLLPDQHILWAKAATRKGRQIITSDNVDLILATGPSFTSFIIGSLLNKFTKKPLIIDYRDPWALNSTFFPGSPIRRFIIRQLEKWCLSRSTAILFATDGFKQLYINKYTWLKDRCHVISNGYDGEVIDYHPRSLPHDEPIIIAYAGKMFGDQYPVSEFFKAIKMFINQHGRTTIQVNMAGEISAENKQALEDYDISDVVQLKGYLHKSEVETMLSSSDAMLLIIGDSHPFLYGLESAKLFEYLRYSRLILALVPKNGAVWKIIESNNLGVTSSPCNAEDIALALNILNQKIRAASSDTSKRSACTKNIERYHRRLLTSKLANLCTNIIDRT